MGLATKKQQNIFILLFLIFYTLSIAIGIVLFEGTKNNGDSIMHYFFAKYAFQHTENFFNHWAKPFFVLLAAPFAQFGFAGIKVFNGLASLFAIFFTYKIATHLAYKNSIVLPLIMLFSPLYYLNTLTGLTEPLYACLLSISIYLVIKRRYLPAYILISLLPFIRSEGLITVGVFGIFAIFNKQWKYLPALLAGHVLYSIAGYFYYHDIFWVFTKIPYATMNSVYGSGRLLHFAEQLIYVVGVPVYVLFWLGVVGFIIHLVKSKTTKVESILIFTGFFAFFIAHSLFWYLGIFNSLGLNRVFIAVMPLIALIALKGLNVVLENLIFQKKPVKMALKLLVIFYILIFPFTGNPAAIDWKKDIKETERDLLREKMANFLIEKDMLKERLFYRHPQISYQLDIDHFDNKRHMNLRPEAIHHLQPGDIVIWDTWFASEWDGFSHQVLNDDPRLIKLKSFYVDGGKGAYIIYQRKN